MNEPLSFLLVLFAVVFLARPVAQVLRIPTLSLYLLSGVIIGPSGFHLIKNTVFLEYSYDLGIILLMFSAGIELKVRVLRKNRDELLSVYLLNAVVPGICGFFTGLFFIRHLAAAGDLFLPFFMATLFASSSIEIILPLFREFAPQTERRIKAFSSILISSTIMAETTSLLSFSAIITYYGMKNLLHLAVFAGFSALFFPVVLKGLPRLQQFAARRFERTVLHVEDQTRILIMLLVIVVAVGAVLHIHPIVCAFLVGISLANVHINRRVLHNIDFITFSVFVPIVFIAIGAQMDLRVFWQSNNFLYPVFLCAALIVCRAGSIFTGARLAGLRGREALGFGFAAIPQLTGTLATAIAAKTMGFLSAPQFDSIIILSIITSFVGPVAARNLIFPGMRHREKEIIASEEFTHFDIRPIPLLTPLSEILRLLQDTELSICPVVDENDTFQGVVHLEDVKNLVFAEELDRLIIAADLLDRQYPSVCREFPMENIIEIFKKPGVYALPVIDECRIDNVYVGMILLRDILSTRL